MKSTSNIRHRIVTCASVMTGRNPEVTADMSPAERARICVEAMMLIALAMLVFAQWHAMLGASSGVSGFLGAAVFTILLVGFDFVIGSAIERLYARGGNRRAQRWLIASRITMSATCAIVLSSAWAVKQFAPQIDANNRITAAAVNAPLRQEIERKLERVRNDVIAPLERELDEKIEARKGQVRHAAELNSLAADFLATANAQAREALKQEEGVLGAHRGQGPLYRFAIGQKEAADSAAAKAASEAAREATRTEMLDAELQTIRNHHQAAVGEFTTLAKKMETHLLTDPRYIVTGEDFLSRLVGLKKLTQDRETGVTVSLMLAATFLLFVVLEVAYLLCKASPYGLTYAHRDVMREHRDLERWAHKMLTQVNDDAVAFSRHPIATDDSPSAAPRPTGAPMQGSGRIVDLRHAHGLKMGEE